MYKLLTNYEAALECRLVDTAPVDIDLEECSPEVAYEFSRLLAQANRKSSCK